MLKVSKLIDWDEKKRHSDTNRAKANERRQDVAAQRSAGIYNPTSSVIPQWFKNINSTFDLVATTTAGRWREWCSKQLDHIGVDYSNPKRKVGRPSIPDSMKKQPIVRTGRSDKMKKLLLDNNIHTTEGDLDYDQSEIYLIEHPTVQLLKNGRLQLHDGTRISVYQFIKDISAN